MMGTMDELIAWLRAQLDEDERVAHAARPGPWTMRENSTPWTDIDAADGTVTSSYEGDVVAVSDAMHIVRWDPACVLAEVDAKRRILDWLVGCEGKALDGNWWNLEVADAMKALALPYADQPGYREEWRPTP